MTTTSPGLRADQRAEPPGGTPDRLDDSSGRQRGRRRFLTSADGDPVWARPALLVLLVATAVLYLQNVSISGNGNDFYAAAVQAASKSWKAWFFGSFDASNFITVDKPPASTWVMGLSARIFGYSSWSMLAPQALECVAAVGLLYAAVKRWSGPAAGLLAGAVLALTPAAALIFRFNNPDALLVLLMTAATYCMVRATENASTKWVLLAGSALGFAFLTKMLQGWLIVPALGLAYLICAPTSFKRRFLQLLGGLVAMIVSCGWWIAIVELVPASDRPYVGGSEKNSILELVFGYNGLGRIFGGDGNGGGGGGGGGTTGGAAGSSFGGATGLNRLFSSEMGNEISWLLPAALVALVAGLMITWGRPRTDRTRAALIMWGGWMLTVGLIFSYMKGTIHPYYTVALAPGIAGTIAVAGAALWKAKDQWRARLGLAGMVLASGLWSYTLLARDADWHPWLRYLLLAVTVIAGIGLLIPVRLGTRVLVALVLAGLLGGITGSASYAVVTASTAHTGSIPSVGPSSASSSTGGFGGGGGGGFPSGGTGTRPGGTTQSGSGTGSTESGSTSSTGSGSTESESGTTTRGGGGGFGGGSSTVDSALVTLLKNAGTKWAAATVGSNSAAPLQLASGQPIMAMGGFSGSDPTPTLAAFKAYVAAGEVRYYISSGSGSGGGGMGGNSEVAEWVAANYTATTVGGYTVYDLQAS
jgi:4-amino-4-deoxy-L-arabinose transferase-like glycosyltransferase